MAGSAAAPSLEVKPTVWVVLTRFQLSSTARITTLKDAPAVWLLGVPVLPVGVPGAAVSPGSSVCSFASAPAPTAIFGLVFAVLPPSATSLAVSVQLPAVLKVTWKVCVPPLSAAFAGSAAFASVLAIPAMSATADTTFQFASTALTVTFSGVPAVCAAGVPVLPVVVPGAAVSPGTNNCIFTKGPGRTTNSALVYAVRYGVVRSVAVRVHVPAVLLVKTNVLVPATKDALAGRTSLASVVSLDTTCAL